MNKFNINDWTDELKYYKSNENVKDDGDEYVLQSYIDFEDFIHNCLDEIISDFGIDIPFGKKIDIFDFSNIIEELEEENIDLDDFIDEIKIENIEVSKGSDLFDIEIYLPGLSEVENSDFIESILEQYEVPRGKSYELDGNDLYPEELKYWDYTSDYDPYENEYHILKNNPLSLNDYTDKINNIKNNFFKTNDDLSKKALILSAFVITESHLKSIISLNLPDTDKYIKNDIYKNIIENTISKKLRDTNGRKELFKQLFSNDENIKKLPNIPNVKLRNNLAHDIESPSLISSYEIEYISNDEKIILKIESIFEQLIEYIKNVMNLIK